MVQNLQKIGGIAALLEGLIYVVGFIGFFTVLTPENSGHLDAAQKLFFILENKLLFQALHLLIYVVFGVLLVVLTMAIHARLSSANPTLMQVATAFGLIWAGLVIASGMVANIGLDTVAQIYQRDVTQANSVWLAISAVQNGLGGGVEVVGGLWILILSYVSLRAPKSMPKALNYLGLLIGITGILSMLPGLSDLGAIFGLGQIIWFLWLGIFMLRKQNSE